MKKKDKKRLYRIIIAAILLAAAVAVDRAGLLSGTLELGSFAPLILALYLVPYVVVGGGVLKKAAQGIARGQVFDENFLMSIATVGAFFTGEYAEAVFVMLFYSVGELFEHIAVGKSRNSIKALLSLQADEATVIRDGNTATVNCDEVEIGEVILIKPGERIPLDAKICEGNSTIDTSALTGESLPREVSVGDEIHSGCVNLGGVIRAVVLKRLEESTASKILMLVESSAENKSRSESFITKFARYYTPAVVIAAVLLAILPPLIIGGGNGIWSDWIYRAMTFLVISCPCALVISVPLSYFSGIGSASSRGILIKGSAYLHTLAHCDTVVFDKTGTLTRGEFCLDGIVTEKGVDSAYLLERAALAEQFSNHPISRSIVTAYDGTLDGTRVCRVEEIFGHGIKAEVDGKVLLVGNRKLMDKFSIVTAEVQGAATSIYVAEDGKPLGYLLISDAPKSGALTSLEAIRRAGISRIVMLTGDRLPVAQEIGKRLSIDEVCAELLPDGKVTALENILGRQAGKKVAYVGDGINDAPVLVRADVGIAMGALGSDAAIEAADIVLMDDELSKIADAISLSRRTRRIVTQNIVFTLGTKAAVLILGALGLVGLNAAVFADVGVAVIAILNSMRNLRK